MKLTPEGNICLIDFNISATLDGDTAWVTGYTNGYADVLSFLREKTISVT